MTTAQEAFDSAQAAYQKRPQHERGSFYDSKARRTEWYFRFEYGHKLRKCGACNGSGYYDHNGSPDCGSCNGTGKESYRAEKAWLSHEKPAIKRLDA